MKTHKVRPILLPTKNIHSQLEIDDISIGKLSYEAKHYHCKHSQELILISLEDEKIEVGNICYYENDFGGGKFLVRYTGNNIYHELGVDPVDQYGRIDCGITPLKSDISKVMARQSQIPSKYISKFIEQYNNNCVDDLEIEISEYFDCKNCTINCIMSCQKDDPIIIQKPKLTNGFVTIVEKEPISFSKY